jgi:nucleoprotein TPR
LLAHFAPALPAFTFLSASALLPNTTTFIKLNAFPTMEDSEMVSRSEPGHQLEVSQPDKKAARPQTIDFVEKKTKLQLNMRDMAQSKITAVRKAVSESPNKPVKEVWDVADKARPDPTVVSSTSSSVAVDFEALHSQHEELRTENEALKASQLRVKEHEARLFAQVEPLKGRVWELEGELENKEDEMRLMQGDRDHWRERTQHIISKYDRVDPVELEGLKKQLEQLKAEQAPLKEQVDGFEARLEEEKSSVLATQQARIDNIKKQAKDQDTMRKEVIARLTQELKTAQETISNLQGGQVATDPMDYSMTAAPAPSPSPESQSSAEGRLTSRQERFCTNPISTADMAKWRLSPEQSRYLAKNNKTLDDLLKADIISKVDQQTSNLKASIAKMEEEIAELLRESRLKDEARANLRAENTSCHTQIVNLNNMRKASGLQIASITKSVLQTPNQPVKEAWEAAVKSSPLQLLHRTKPYSEMIW